MGKKHYASFGYYMVAFDEDEHSLVFIEETLGARITMDLTGLFVAGEKRLSFSDFGTCSVARERGDRSTSLTIRYFGADELPKPEIAISVDPRGITLVARELDFYEFRAAGHIYFGEGERVRSVSSGDDPEFAFRSAIGPATSRGDNAIFDGERDALAVIDGIRGLRIKYDWSEGAYGYTLRTMSEGVAEKIRIHVKKNLLGEKFSAEYKPLQRRGSFDEPPAGFMTWYALKFDTCERRLLQNVEFQKKYLKDYGANTVWVDWEWCHRRYERERDDGVNNLSPDMEKYPHGLGYVSDKIKEAGFRSAVWIGATNDISFSDFERDNPAVSLAHEETWSGMYYYDISCEEYLNGYLPRAFGQIKEWGFDAVKYDTLPNCITAHEKHHGNMKHPELTTYTAYRNMLKKTREILGEDVFMLGCGGSLGAGIYGIGYFDATRVGPDLFTWEKFAENLCRVSEYYPLHNNAIMVDADCVVLREEYSNSAEARSRLASIALLGLPLTFGDDLPALPNERVELLKRGLPVLKTFPSSHKCPITDGVSRLFVTKIEKPWESYTVVGVTNLSSGSIKKSVDFYADLKLYEGEYLAYSFFDGTRVPCAEGGFEIALEPHDTAVIAVRERTGKPQLLSTSRHITQGAAEIENMSFEDNKLSIKASLVEGDEYKIAIYLTRGYEFLGTNVGKPEISGDVLVIKYTPTGRGNVDFEISFKEI